MAALEQAVHRAPADSMASRRHRKPCVYQAYLPDRLAALDLRLHGDVAADVADAERAVLGLNLDHGKAHDLEALARVLLRAEAVASSRIEGLTVAHRRLLKYEAARMAGVHLADATAQAVLGNVAAMQTAISTAERPGRIGLDDLLAIHAALMAAGDHPEYGGVLRREQNWIRGQTPCVAEFVPPPFREVEPLMHDLCEFLNDDSLSPLTQAAIAHAQFETIHPFLDGNGRAGRAVIHVVLRRRGLASRYVPPISLALATAADAYVAGLGAYRYVGEANGKAAQDGVAEWVAVLAAATRRACAEAQRLVSALDRLQEGWRAGARPRSGSTADLVLALLARAPVLTAATVASMTGRSAAAAGNAIDQLVEAGVLVQTTAGRRNRAFEAPEVFDVLHAHERALASPTGDTSIDPPVRPVPTRR